MPIKKHDFIELDFIGKLKDSNEIFDLTEESIAKENNILNPKFSYKPVKICIGEKHLVKGLDDFIIGKDPGNYRVELKAENAFGKKDPKLMRLIPESAFKDKNIKPFPGLKINMDGFLGVVRSASGGRVIMDFNHPLAGRDVVYEIKIKRIITDPKEKAQAVLDLFHPEIKFDIKNSKLTIKLKLPKQIEDSLSGKIKELIPEIKEVIFEEDKEKSQKSNEKESEKV